jgi:hypothetical protein
MVTLYRRVPIPLTILLACFAAMVLIGIAAAGALAIVYLLSLLVL